MSALTEKLTQAQKYALSIKPSVGGFPILAEALRQSGIKSNSWSLPSCQSVYVLSEGAVVQQGTPLVTGTHEIPKYDQVALIRAIRADQQGKSSFSEFLLATWNSGVISYVADFVGRKVTYFGVNGEAYLEEYPAVELPK